MNLQVTIRGALLPPGIVVLGLNNVETKYKYLEKVVFPKYRKVTC